ncbi:MAG: stage II sporulation protein R [Defluviitaleaceae bacterium]|nr:stage II sporulation protein R [Defluviitaleaceae bacterium]
MKIHTKELKQAFILGVLITFLYSINTAARDFAELQEAGKRISNELVRLHIIARDDSEEAKNEKMKIKKETLKKLEPLLENITSVEEARNILYANLHIFERNEINPTLEKRSFPFIRYANFRLPAGYYKALVLEIGESNGSNWWCVLFPTLCFLEDPRGIANETLYAENDIIFRLRVWDIIF